MACQPAAQLLVCSLRRWQDTWPSCGACRSILLAPGVGSHSTSGPPKVNKVYRIRLHCHHRATKGGCGWCWWPYIFPCQGATGRAGGGGLGHITSPLLAPTAQRAHGFLQPQAFAGGPRSAGGVAGVAARDEAVSFQAASQAPSPQRWERHPSNHSRFPQRGGSSQEGQAVRATSRGCTEEPVKHRVAPHPHAAAAWVWGQEVPSRCCRAEH